MQHPRFFVLDSHVSTHKYAEIYKCVCDLIGQNQSHVAICLYGVKYTSF